MSLAALALFLFVLFLIAQNDVGRVINAWALFFLVLFVALGLGLAAWAFRSRRLVRAAKITAFASPVVFLLWYSWNWATFLRFPDIPSETVLFSHNWRWSVDGNGDAVLLPETRQGLCPCDGMTFRPPRSDPLACPPPPELRFEGAAPRLRSSAWALPVATKALAALADPAAPPPEQVCQTRGLDDLAPDAIGYSMHVMAAPLVREGMVRLISVGGAAPTAADIAAGHYPPGRVLELITAKPQDGNLRKLAAFLRSPMGRALLASAGFIPVSPDDNG